MNKPLFFHNMGYILCAVRKSKYPYQGKSRYLVFFKNNYSSLTELLSVVELSVIACLWTINYPSLGSVIFIAEALGFSQARMPPKILCEMYLRCFLCKF